MKKSIGSVFLAFVFLTILLSGCAPASTPVPPTLTPIPPTDTPVPTATPTKLPTVTPTPTEIPINPDWWNALNSAGGEKQFPLAEGSPLLCAIDVKSARSVNILVEGKEILNIADCYYKDINGETQVISVSVIYYVASKDAVYFLGSASPTKGLGKPGQANIDNWLSHLAEVMSPEGRALIYMLMIPSPNADFLATGTPASFPTIGNATKLVIPSSSAITLGW